MNLKTEYTTELSRYLQQIFWFKTVDFQTKTNPYRQRFEMSDLPQAISRVWVLTRPILMNVRIAGEFDVKKNLCSLRVSE